MNTTNTDAQDAMNMLSAIAPTSVPVDPLGGAPTAVQVAVMKTALDARRAEGQAIVALLDPNVGKRLDAKA